MRNGECSQAYEDQLNDRPVDGRATEEVPGRRRCHQNAKHGQQRSPEDECRRGSSLVVDRPQNVAGAVHGAEKYGE